MSSRSEEPAYPTIIEAKPGCFVMFLTMSSPAKHAGHLPRVRRPGHPDRPRPHLAGPGRPPGELAGIGPIDPDLARDLAGAAARNPRTTWCVTVTDSQGHAIGHGCARPAPASTAKRRKPGTPDGPDPPGPHRFTFTPPASPSHRADTGPGGSRPGSPASGTCSSTSGRSPPATATTGTRPGATTPGSRSGTSRRSGTPPVPGPAAPDPL
jgi:hypothetical protein